MVQPRYRYFLAFLPSNDLRAWLDSLADLAGQARRRVRTGRFHLTLCVIAEPICRDRFIASRADSALAGFPLASCPFWLGRLCGRPGGAAVHASGRQSEIQSFYRTLLILLADRDILPLHRKSGLHPHATLGYDPCRLDLRVPPRQWIPDALVLIESEVGRGIHNLLAQWPLLVPRQGSFVFGAAPEPGALHRDARAVPA